MNISFIPAALPKVLEWSRDAYQEILRALFEAQALSRSTREPADLSAAYLIQLPEIVSQRRRFLALSVGANEAIVLAASEELNTEIVIRLAHNLERSNWREHLLSVELSGLERSEFLPTLVDIVASMEVSHAHPAPRQLPTLLLDRLHHQSRAWGTKAARHSFKELLDAAAEGPQVIDRPDGERVYLVSEAMLQRFTNEQSARDLVLEFSEPPHDMRMGLRKRPPARRPVEITSTFGSE